MPLRYIAKSIKEKKARKKLFWLARSLILLSILLIVVCFVYVNEVGLPAYFQNSLLKYFEDKGYRIAISNAKFVWYRGIVAENPRIEIFLNGDKLILESRTIDILPSLSALLSKKVEIEKLKISNGALCFYKSGETNKEPHCLRLDNLNSVIKFYKNGIRYLDLSSNIKKTRLNISASDLDYSRLHSLLTNSFLKYFTFNTSKPGSNTYDVIFNYLEECETDADSKVDFVFKAPVDKENKLMMDVTFNLPFILGEQFFFDNLKGELHNVPITANNNEEKTKGKFKFKRFQAGSYSLEGAEFDVVSTVSVDKIKNIDILFSGEDLKSKNIELRKFRNNISIESIETFLDRLDYKLKISGQTSLCKYYGIQADEIKYDATYTKNLARTNLILKASFDKCGNNRFNIGKTTFNYDGFFDFSKVPTISGQLKLDCEFANIEKYRIEHAVYDGEINQIFTSGIPSRLMGLFRFNEIFNEQFRIYDGKAHIFVERRETTNESHFSNFGDILNHANIALDGEFKEIKSKDIVINKAVAKVKSNRGNLQIDSFSGEFDTGRINVSGNINNDINSLNLILDSSLAFKDLRKIARLNIGALSNYLDSSQPIYLGISLNGMIPRIKDLSSINLTNLIKELNIRGNCTLPAIKTEIDNIKNIKDIEVLFNYSKNKLNIDRLCFILNTNNVNANLVLDLENNDISANISGFINPVDAFKILHLTNAETISLISNALPFEISGNINANFNDVKNKTNIFEITNLNMRFAVAATNFSFKEKLISELRCVINYSNKIVTISNVELTRPDERATAEAIIADFNTERVHLVNARGNLSPSDLTQAIGEDVYNAMLPFRFNRQPTVRANGSVPMHGSIGDIEFDVFAPEMEWWKIKVKNASSKILWKNETVTFKNFYSEFYNGNLNLDLFADFSETGKTNLYYNAKISRVDFNELLKSLLKKSRRIEGNLSGHLEIYSPSITNYYEWYGRGQATLEEGLIWDIPIFGIFSPILNTISPGLGNSRANYASANFVVTNGIVATDNLEIRAKTIRMKYEGTVDFDKKIDARVEAELLRDIWLVGPAIRFLLKPLTKLFIYKVSGTLDNPVSEPLFIPKILLAPLHPFKTIKDYILPSNKEDSDGENK